MQSSLATQTKVTPLLSWSTPAAITYGTALDSSELNATATVTGSFSYSPAVGTLLETGSHTLSVSFTPEDTEHYNSTTATIELVVNKATPVISWSAPAAIAYGTALSAAQLNATANVAGSFTYSPAAGTTLAAGIQSLSATFTPTDTSNYQSVSASVSLQVNKVTPVVTWSTPAAITYGTALSATQLNATANVAGSFSYEPAAGSLLEPGTYNLSVAFTPGNTEDYENVTNTTAITVNKIVPVIAWSAPSAITYGTALSSSQLNATCSVAGSMSYNPAAGTVLEAGSEVLSATCTPTDSDHNETVSSSVALTIKQATPAISWTPPDSIPLEVALSNTQLDASAASPLNSGTLAGSFTYAPASGTRFTSTGTQTLQAVFTPSDTTNFSTVTTTRSISVTSFGLVGWGDSQTSGNLGYTNVNNYPALLAKQVYLAVAGQGFPGATSTQIAVAEGAVKSYATVADGVIPASGSVAVTFATGAAQPAGNGLTGSIQNVHGTLVANSGGYLFTRTTAGDAVTVSGSPQFVVDTPYASYWPIIWVGNNNPSQLAQILSDVAAMVSTVSNNGDYVVLPLVNYNISSYWSGGTIYNQIMAVNAQLAYIYGSHYIDVRKLLVDAYDATSATDVADYEHDVPPTSLRPIYSSGTLSSDVGVSDTTMTLKIAGGSVATGQILTLDTGANSENASITAVSGNTVTVNRCYSGACVAHAAGVSFTTGDPIHFNASGYQVVADAVAKYFAAYAK